MADFELDGYFARIGYAGPRAPTLETLRAIHALHPQAIPFENLDPLLGRPVALEAHALQSKLIWARRGGYCFEHNGLLAGALAALGIPTTTLAARVRWMAPPDRPDGPRTHMLLLAELPEGAFLADVGFGGFLLGGPVRLLPDQEQDLPGGVVRLLSEGIRWTAQARLPSGWQDMYRFTLEPQVHADLLVANWFTATHPASPFTGNLMVQLLAPERRLSLFNTQLTVRDGDGEIERRALTGPGELGEVLTGLFGIELPAEPAIIWDRLPAA